MKKELSEKVYLMIKIQLLSDLHVEFYKNSKDLQIEDTDAELIILVGDIHTKTRGIKWLLEQKINKPILYVCGNHEYWGGSYPHTLDKMKEATRGTNIYVLENDYYIHNDLVILGSSLWTDYKLFEPVISQSLARNECYKLMNDFTRIRNSNNNYKKISSIDLLDLHIKSLEFLTTYLELFKDWNIGIATHHSPSIKGVNPIYYKDVVSSAYCSNLDEFVAYSGAKFWAFGHTHYKVDTYIGDTRLISNPRGYLGHLVEEFDPRFTFEV